MSEQERTRQEGLLQDSPAAIPSGGTTASDQPQWPAPAEEAVIDAEDLKKHFGAVKALDGVSCRIIGASIFGLIGSNGAGKSTFLRLAAGVYKPTAGHMLYRGQPVFENTAAKSEIQFVADQPYYEELRRIFPLREEQRLDHMSKGMQRQAALILAIAAKPRLLLMDEAFDGLDPVMRQNLKRVLARQVSDSGMTVLIASQNLRELEDFCDHVGLLHEGGLLFVEELDKLRLGLVKAQIAFREPVSENALKDLGLDILRFSARGSLIEILSRNTEQELRSVVIQQNPLLLDVLPLTLEEVFIYELSRKSYVVSELLA